MRRTLALLALSGHARRRAWPSSPRLRSPRSAPRRPASGPGRSRSRSPPTRWGRPSRTRCSTPGRTYQGAQGPIYPYPLLDQLSSEKEDRAWQALWLENEYVKLSVLPEIGGRIFTAEDRTNGYDFFYRQHVIKPALIGMLGAWISGGVEWNVLHHHRATSFMPVQSAITEHDDGSRTIWVGETEWRHRMRWVIGLTLRPGSNVVEQSVRMINRTPIPHSVLYFANPAVHANESYQILFPPDVQWTTFHAKNDFSAWPIADGPYRGIDYAPGTDLSWWKNHPKPVSFFVYDSDLDFFGGYDHGRRAGVVHVADHETVPGKKLWEWGNGPDGFAWDAILTDEDGPYIELMAGGFSDNQPDYSWIEPGQARTLVQHWYPIRELGGLEAANPEGALHLEIDGPTARLAANTTSRHEGARVRLTAGERLLFEDTVTLAPDAPWTGEVSLPAGVEADRPAPRRRRRRRPGAGVLPARRPRGDAGAAPLRGPAVPRGDGQRRGAGARRTAPRAVPQPRPRAGALLPGGPETGPGLLVGPPGPGSPGPAPGPFRGRRGAPRRRGGPGHRQPHPGPQRPGAVPLRPGPRRPRPDQRGPRGLRRRGVGPGLHRARVARPGPARGLHRGPGPRPRASRAGGHAPTRRAPPPSASRRPSCATPAMSTGHSRRRPRPWRSTPSTRWRPGSGPSPGAAGAAAAPDPAVDPAAGAGLRSLDEDQYALEIAHDYARAGLLDDAVAVLEGRVPAGCGPRRGHGRAPWWRTPSAWLRGRQGDAAAAATWARRGRELPSDYCFPFRLESIAVLEYAMALDASDPRAPYYLGNLLYDIQPERAIEEWETARALDPELPPGAPQPGLRLRPGAERPRGRGGQPGDGGDPREGRAPPLLRARPAPRLVPALRSIGGSPGSRTAPRRWPAATSPAPGWPGSSFSTASPTRRSRPSPAGRFHVWEGERGIHEVYVQARLERGRRRLAAGDGEGALEEFRAAVAVPANIEVGRDTEAHLPAVRFHEGSGPGGARAPGGGRGGLPPGRRGAPIGSPSDHYWRGRSPCRSWGGRRRAGPNSSPWPGRPPRRWTRAFPWSGG